jgi:hypothetical protein
MSGKALVSKNYDTNDVTIGFLDSPNIRTEAFQDFFKMKFPEYGKGGALSLSGQDNRFFPPTLNEFMRGAKHRKELIQEFERTRSFRFTAELMVAFNWQDAVRLNSVTVTTEGYEKYLELCVANQGLGQEFNSFLQTYDRSLPHISFDGRVREGHTAIFGGSNAGKSELMKVLIAHELWHTSSGVLVVDPHGKMAYEMSRASVFRSDGRLAYFRPQRDGWSVKINPLDAKGMTTRDKAAFAEILAEILGELVDKADQTPRMQTMVVNCLRVLFDTEGATLRDLRNFLRGAGHPLGKPWWEKGKRHSNPDVAEYFAYDFPEKRLNPSREGLRDRLSTLLSMEGFSARFCEPANIRLSDLLNARKVVLFDFSDLSGRTRTAAGRLVLGMVAGMGLRRIAEGGKHVPVHVFLDEASTMLGRSAETILTETRKARIYLTLAQQVEGAGLGGEARRILRTNTAIKFASETAREILTNEMGLDPRKLEGTAQGQFWVKWGANAQSMKVSVTSALKRGTMDMSPDEWSKMMREQRKLYYKPPAANQPADGAPAGPPPDKAQPVKTKRPRPR